MHSDSNLLKSSCACSTWLRVENFHTCISTVVKRFLSTSPSCDGQAIPPPKTARNYNPFIHNLKASIHLLPLIRSLVTGAAAPAGSFRLPCPEQHQQLPPGGSQGVPKPARRCNPSIWSLVCPGVFSQWDAQRGPP